jgi:hypothetical protein
MKSKIVVLLAMVLLLALPNAAAAAYQPDEQAQQMPVQVFDVVAGKVVKTVANTKQYQDYAKTWLQSVTGFSPQLQPEEKCGYVYRIPLAEPYTIQTGGMTIQTSDVFLFYCPDKPKVLLVFDENRRPYLLQFTADIAPFLKTIGIP